jgi:Zn-finger nucleic acid-binding protein
MVGRMNCPACKSAADEQGFEGVNGKRVLLDVCHTCHGLWFDTRENLQLSAKGVLHLFRQQHGRRDQHHRLKEPLACPRCRAKLERAHDMARGNRYQYFRCPDGHGHFITFFQFLREKGIVRGLNPKEIAELKKHVQALQCSDCGGPISLARDSACPSCSAPLCILDPKALGSTLGDVKQAAAVAGAVVAPAVAAQLLMEQMKMDGFYRRLDSHAYAASTASASSQHQAQASSGLEGSDAAEVAVEVVDVGLDVAANGGVDLLDVGVDFFLDVVGGIGDLF